MIRSLLGKERRLLTYDTMQSTTLSSIFCSAFLWKSIGSHNLAPPVGQLNINNMIYVIESKLTITTGTAKAAKIIMSLDALQKKAQTVIDILNKFVEESYGKYYH